jgi:membrane protease YdiL (CAAX protease family)
MNPLTKLVRDHPITSFAFLACLFGWSIFIAAALGLGSNPDNMPLGPLLAALVVASCQGRESLRSWGRQLRHWRVAPRWYAVAVLVPIAVHVVDVGVNHLLGAALPTLSQLSAWPEILSAFVVMLVMVGIGEEAGWTAFAAPLLLRRNGLLTAWLVLSGIRILWHLPLMLTGEMPWFMGIVGNAAFQMIVLQLFLRSGSWTPAAVWHATLNAFGGAFFFTMVVGADRDRLGTLLAVAYAVVAVTMVVLSRRTAARSSEPEVAIVQGWSHDRRLQHQSDHR